MSQTVIVNGKEVDIEDDEGSSSPSADSSTTILPASLNREREKREAVEAFRLMQRRGNTK